MGMGMGMAMAMAMEDEGQEGQEEECLRASRGSKAGLGQSTVREEDDKGVPVSTRNSLDGPFWTSLEWRWPRRDHQGCALGNLRRFQTHRGGGAGLP